ncbi:PRTRC system protein E [Burkholderia cenocepacia]|uniref:PRTRC system protein E n=1 Tax=Burkholderia cenocepacia TaxID=95486 RepID=UPI001B920725|nr:PRTRC system protein E [Burkholderia cenocepacia]MBR7987989.1 PRTRC system protein E [Burkholderia cenocepacia]MBR8309506.1 PRTRC system protein E [Burkholderia cenocepacia]MCA7966341.1 PRTRC system protein E [Burkholderia cenocepacia]MDR8058072.1 PRTRC system protein E [Burkholderia cenocepacia]MDR8061838.1 PRTRC system protein E [Burkholderia cenocepacia]
MSLFTSLHALAQTTSINILITAEGPESLRVNVTPMPNGKGEKQRWPLSLLATPAELDAEFAAAVEVYAPGATPLLDQARACAAANQPDSAPALPAPSTGDAAGTPGKRGRGRPPKAAKADDANNPPSTDGGNAGETDPRQMRIDDGGQPSDGGETPAADTPAPAEPASAAQPQSTDAGVDLY